MSDEPVSSSDADAVERHRDALVSRAVAILEADPDRRVVGLVAEADAPEARILRETPRAFVDPSGSVSVILTRESAQKLLGAATAGLLDWLEDDRAGPRRVLPVIHAARRGMRTTVIAYDA